jgi:glycine cleavage system H protein
MAEMKFTKTHEWMRLEDDDIATIGITERAQHTLGDIVFVELPDVGKMIAVGKECAVIESVKSASDIYAPVSGEIIAINDAVVANPGIINQDPQAEGWLFKIKLSDAKEFAELMDTNAYETYLAETSH